MAPQPLAVVSEDLLTQALLHKCISYYLPTHTVIRSEVKHGRGNIQREIRAYERLSERIPVVLGVDLDLDECAPRLLDSWGIKKPAFPQLLLRVAVREAEAWLLADRQQVAKFIGAQADDLTKDPDSLEDPKRSFLDHVYRVSDNELRRDLLPRNFGKHPRIGPAYNLRICDFISKRWRPHVAATRSDSLFRATLALRSLVKD